MSSIIFNAVTHLMLERLLSEVSARLGGMTINAAAFADDLLLFAATPEGLQSLIETTAGYLAECGMTINPAKSITIAIKVAQQEDGGGWWRHIQVC